MIRSPVPNSDADDVSINVGFDDSIKVDPREEEKEEAD